MKSNGIWVELDMTSSSKTLLLSFPYADMSSWNGFCTRWTNCQDNCQGSKCNFCSSTLVEGSDPKICKSVIKLLCFLSEGGSQEVSRFLLNKNKLQLFVSFLEDDSKGDVQAATAGILANLPASEMHREG
jgi:hypothetical protein